MTQPSSRFSKLDGVLYHFYSKTLAVITNARLTHYSGGSFYDGNAADASSSSSSSSSRRTSRWFELDLADYDFFREEVRLWRNISQMIPASILESRETASSSANDDASFVPSMILDVILDTSALTSSDLLVLERMDSRGAIHRVKVDTDAHHRSRGTDSPRRSGKAKEEQNVEQQATPPQSIILETWTLQLTPGSPSDPPDLPVLYRHATTHLKELSAIAKQLPVFPMFNRLQQGKETRTQEQSLRSGVASKLGCPLKIGVRLATEGENDDDLCPLNTSIISNARAGQEQNVTQHFDFEPINTPIGSLRCSVEYRAEADFYVEDVQVVQNLQDLQLDEEYFRPSDLRKAKMGTTGPIAMRLPAGSPSSEGSRRPTSPSLLTTTSGARRLAAENDATTPSSTAPRPSNTPSPTGMVPTTSGIAPSTSVFSTAASSGKPVAGLSSLRRSPSTTIHGTSPTTSVLPGSGPSASIPISEAAFLTHGRRASQSERRLRTISSLSGSGSDKGSPILATNTIAGSPAQPSAVGRPILARGGVGGAGTMPSLRTGSFSPSSPSPLAQQLYAASQQLYAASQQNAPAATSPLSARKISTSPSIRAGVPIAMSVSPSLRSVFQTYTGSQSQSSISSLSRTPPRSLTGEGSSPSTAVRPASSSLAGAHIGSQQAVDDAHRPSVAPQMIKRYSSTFGYRQGRHGSAGGNNSDISLGGGSGSLGGASPYSKSWQARLEQRHQFIARSLGREEGSHLSGSSAGAGSGGPPDFASSYSPRYNRRSLNTSLNAEEDLSDFVRMIDSSQPDLRRTGNESEGSSGDVHGRRSAEARFSGTGRHQQTRSDDLQDSSPSVDTEGAVSVATQPRDNRRHQGLSRNQVDEILSKMQNSAREYSSSRGSGNSGDGAGGAARASSYSPASSTGGGAGGELREDNQSAIGIAGASPRVSSIGHSTSPSFARSPLSRVGFSAVPRDRVNENTMPALPSTTQRAGTYRYDPAMRQMQEEVYGRGGADPSRDNADTAHAQSAAPEDNEGGEGGDTSTVQEGSVLHHHDRLANRTASAGSLESFSNRTPGDCYDSMEDEAVGRLELVQEDVGPSDEITSRNMAAAHQVTMDRSQLHQQHQQQEQRRADIEMARNFGAVVSSSSNRGNARASISPWRNRMQNLASGGNGGGNTGGGAANPSFRGGFGGDNH